MTDVPSVDFSCWGGAPADAFSPSVVAAGVADKSLLGKIRGFASLSAVRKRYFLLSAARELYPVKGLSCCRRWLIPGKPNVTILRSIEHQKCFYGNLIRCGLLWVCPLCGALISERRLAELLGALEPAPYHKLLATFTLRHKLSDSLQAVLDALLNSFRDFQSGKGWVSLQQRYGFVGSVRGLEVTYGASGWHTHIHSLMLFQNGFSTSLFKQLQSDFKNRWLMSLGRQGFDATWRRGLEISSDQQQRIDYIEKFGREPLIFGDGRAWTNEHELVKSVVKLGRNGGRTPGQLLLDYALFGDRQAGLLWQEYANCFKGRHQLQWSRGLRDLLDLGVQSSDEQLATDDEDHVTKLYELTAEQWQRVLNHQLCGQLLELADFAGADAVDAILRVAEESPDTLQTVLRGFYGFHGREYVPTPEKSPLAAYNQL